MSQPSQSSVSASASPRPLPRQAPPLLASAARCLSLATGYSECWLFATDEGAKRLMPLLPAGTPSEAAAKAPCDLHDAPALLQVLGGAVLPFDCAGLPADSAWRACFEAWGVEVGVAFPLAPEHGPVVGFGVLVAPSGPPNVSSELVRQFGHLMGRLLMDRYHALRLQLQQREQELSTLYALTAAAVESRNLDHLLDRALGSILEVTRLEGGLLLYREAETRHVFLAHRGLDDQLVKASADFEASRDLVALYQCLAGGEAGPGDAPARRLRRRYHQALSTWMVLPLHTNSAFNGLLLLGSADYSQLSDELSQLLWTITNQLILSIERQQAYAHLESQVERRTIELTESHRQLMEKVEELKRMDQYKTDFLSNVSHELRTPLSGIIGYGEFLTEEVYGPLNADQTHVLDQLISNGYRLMELINNLLDLSRIDAGKLQLYCEPIEVATLFQQSVGQVLPQAIQKDIRLEAPEADSPLVEVDPSRVVQVLVNLLSNAIKFTPAGGTVSVGFEPYGEGILVSVTDTGIGIPEEHRAKLFERFSQGDSSTTRQYGGTGLGLAISRELIELHGQRIGVESTVGVGSRFYFTLPLWRSEA